jgi:uncharacterized membrane protein YeaQ/YmgE (transglycosylase-associated protein family)
MSYIAWIVFGAVVGGTAKWIFPGTVPQGWLPAIGVGIAGSVIGGLPFGHGPAGLVGSVIGSLVVIYLYTLWRAQ